MYSLGREFSNAEKVNKILRSLPENWEAKVTAISESKDLENYSLDTLIGSLLAYEQKKVQRMGESSTEKKREKVIALKIKNKEESSSDESTD
ncbi:hypothetical protein, partial [Streptococcus anginosus]|uniref:hypothetical protein n=1 Tax=Streptococcus anginosus TaxID=1328 RepID=UPI002ED9D78B